VPTNQQRREAERRRLQRQLEERRAREAARKRMTLIGSIIGTLIVVAGIVLAITLTAGGGSTKAEKDTVSSPPSPTATPSTSAAASTPPAPTAPCTGVPKGTTASFHGVTVGRATDLAHEPKVSAKGTGTPANLECEDLVVGKGKPATPGSTVTVQYTGVLYKDGKLFDSSWSRGQPAQFSLTGTIPGFSEGIGGAGKVAPMRVGGRRILVMPPSLGYGAAAQQSIPANSTLVFVVDLKAVG
jgi:hypothetical protein